MNIEDVKKIAVIGAGNMGHQISLLCAMHGYTTTCTDINEDILKKAEAFTDAYLPGRVKKGRLTEEQARTARERITFTSSMETAVKKASRGKSLLSRMNTVIAFVRLERLSPTSVRKSMKRATVRPSFCREKSAC